MSGDRQDLSRSVICVGRKLPMVNPKAVGDRALAAVYRPWWSSTTQGGQSVLYSSECVGVEVLSEVRSIKESRDSSFGPGPLLLEGNPRCLFSQG